MTPLEQEAYHVFLMVRDRYALGQSRYRMPEEYVMGWVARMIERLNNNKFGCATGEHRSACTCRPAIKGRAITALIEKKVEIRKAGRPRDG